MVLFSFNEIIKKILFLFFLEAININLHFIWTNLKYYNIDLFK